MTCHSCKTQMVRAGFHGKDRVQRYKCQQCGRRLCEPRETPFGADIRIPREKVTTILHLLAEGNSVRSTARLCSCEKRTILSILRLAGEACERFLEKRICNVKVENLELDECWTYTAKKQGHLRPEEMGDPNLGDQYVFVALARESKLIVAWHVGKRDKRNTEIFIEKIRSATAAKRFDVSTDAWMAYPDAINLILSDRANHTQVLKVFEGENSADRYAPGRFITVDKTPMLGRPNLAIAGTSRVERFNGSMRLWIKRMGRLTYAFSKRLEFLRAAIALSLCFYNFCRASEYRPENGEKRLTPAQEAGICDHALSMAELVSLL